MSITPEYIAGFFDGEGCILARKVNNKRCAIHLSMGQKNPFILNEIQNYLDYGILKKAKGKNKKRQEKDIWRYRITKIEDCLSFLQMIQPYLLGKKRQLDLALIFLNRQLESKWKHQSKEEKNYREKIICEITKLKKEEYG